jgi:hypothetical protein
MEMRRGRLGTCCGMVGGVYGPFYSVGEGGERHGQAGTAGNEGAAE